MKRVKRINIKKLAVRFEFRSMGLGSDLIQKIKAFNLDIQVYISKHNSESFQWYEKHDFKFIEERENTNLLLWEQDVRYINDF
jgi:ribosomal protein S18 acetylase RimI-like enzyme